MEFTAKTTAIDKLSTECLVLPLTQAKKLSKTAEKVDKLLQNTLAKLLKQNNLPQSFGQTLVVPIVEKCSIKKVILVSTGNEDPLNEKQFIDICNKTFQTMLCLNLESACVLLTELPVRDRAFAWKVHQIGYAAHQAYYQFNELKSTPAKKQKILRELTFISANRTEQAQANKATQEVQAITRGMTLVRNLANLPANICTPSYLADQAKQLAKQYKSVNCAILEEKEMLSLQMGALLSVTHGSNHPAKLITLEYRGVHKSKKPIVLVGKGITFDTGGNSLKSAANMIGMKYDMCGGATVFGAILAAAELNLPIHLIGVVPACENMPGPNATRPDDIVTSMSGKTIEILNTDAEGRLILADALTYCERYQPDTVIDIATLTGACVIALGRQAIGLMSNHQPLADALLEAGNQAYDRAWQLPLWSEYSDALDSEFADIANIASTEVGAGTILAGCFLAKFAEKFHWAHLDIAGVASPYIGLKRGATGRPLAMLMHYLFQRCDN